MLRKIALVAAFVILYEGMACAAPLGWTDITETTLSTPSNSQAGFVFKPSHNVRMFYENDSALRAQNYGVAAKHDSGNRTFFTSNLATGLYFKEDATVKDGVQLSTSNIPDSSSLTAGFSTQPSGWTGL